MGQGGCIFKQGGSLCKRLGLDLEKLTLEQGLKEKEGVNLVNGWGESLPWKGTSSRWF